MAEQRLYDAKGLLQTAMVTTVDAERYLEQAAQLYPEGATEIMDLKAELGRLSVRILEASKIV